MIRRAVVLASVLLAGVPATAAATTELNVIPHGQGEPGVSLGARRRACFLPTRRRSCTTGSRRSAATSPTR